MLVDIVSILITIDLHFELFIFGYGTNEKFVKDALDNKDKRVKIFNYI